MGNVISRNASIDRILEAATKTLAMATARGGEVQSLAEARIAPLVAALDSNQRQLHATLMARDNESDLEIGAVCDEIWNAMGRPSQSVDYDLIVNGGKNVWTDGDPVKQPHLMGVLAANIRNSKHPKLADKKEAWAKRIEAKAAAQAQAAAPTETAHAQATGLTMQRRTLADATQVGLTRLKRDLKNLGMTEAQVHEIIPEAPTGSGSTPPPPKPVPAPAP
jgi:hypothetical protein